MVDALFYFVGNMKIFAQTTRLYIPSVIKYVHSPESKYTKDVDIKVKSYPHTLDDLDSVSFMRI